MTDMRCENCTYWTGGLRVWGYCTQHSKDTSNTDSCIMWMDSGWAIKKQSNNLPDTNVGNTEYIRMADAVNAVEFGITLASAINIETGERTELFQRENDELREAVKRIKDIEPADVAPVEYGEWISVPEMWGAFDVRYYCSKCGKDAIINNSERYVLSDYCPHCGAIMGNKKGNENG